MNRWFRASTFFTAVALSALPCFADTYGRFLVPADESSVIHSYLGRGPVAFDQDVFCGVLKCGEIKFDYDTYLREPGTASGGGALSGGFYLDPGAVLAAGHSLIWVQTVKSTQSGLNDWGIDPNAGPFEFPDAAPDDPSYAFMTTSATPADPPGVPTLGFQDFPTRLFADGNQSWLAELALVCMEDTAGADGFMDGWAIFGFIWGFGMTAAPDSISGLQPAAFGAPSANFLSTLNEYYDGEAPAPPTPKTASSLYRFQAGCDDCFQAASEAPGNTDGSGGGSTQPVPEPGTFVLAAPLVFGLWWRRGKFA